MDRVREAALGFLWSLWTELGVPGPNRRHTNAVIDPERLIISTPSLARDDPRLLDLAFAWCVQHAHRVSSSRISALLREARADVRFAAEQMLGELAGEGVVLARAEPRPSPRPRDSRSILVQVERPALLRLRVRALAGVSGRADVLLALLSSPSNWASAGDLDDAGIAKRNVARILSELAEAGIAHTRQRGNVHEFRLAHAAALGELVAVPAFALFPAWRSIFDWMHLVDELGGLPVDRPATMRVEVARRRDTLESIAATLALPKPTLPLASDQVTSALLTWGNAVAEDIAAGVGPLWEPREAVRTDDARSGHRK